MTGAGPRSRLLTTMRILSGPFEWLPRWCARYGDPVRLKTLNGTVWLTGRPALVKQIFAGAPAGYGPFATEAVTGFAGPGSLLAVSGERHTKERKLLSPPFRGAQMRALGPAMADAARRRFATAGDGSRCRMADLARDISLEAIIRTVFGVEEETRVAAFTTALVRYLDVANPLFFFVKAAQSRWFPPWRAFERAFATLDALLQEQIESVRRSGEDRTILGAMLAARYDDGTAMRDEDIKSQLRTLLFAGHDTTAITLTWAVDHIGRDEDLAERLREHVDGLEDTPRAYADSELLEAVWKETLRLHPVITEALRTLNSPMQLGEVEVPEGEAVAACISLIHLDPEIYPEPERFDPQRFLSKNFANHEYLPFGGGHRRCIGAAFAGYQLQVVLGILLRHYRFEVLDPVPPKTVRRSITLVPKGDVPVRLSVRS